MFSKRALGAALALGLGAAGVPSVAGARTPATTSYLVAPSTDDKAQERYQAGLEAFEAERFEEAAAAFEEAFELAGDPTLLYNVSIAYEKSGKLDKALEVLDQYSQLAPDSERDDIDRQRKALALRIEKSEQEAEQAPAAAPERTEPAQEPTKTRGKPERDRPVPERVFTPAAISMVTLSVIAIGVGTGLAIPAARADDQVEQECVEGGGTFLCQDTNSSLVQRRQGLALGADISFGIGIVAGVAAIALLATNASRIRRARTEPKATAVVSPTLGRRSAGLSLTTRF